MIRLKPIALIISLVTSMVGVSQNETPTSNYKKNTVDIYYPAFYFFDSDKPTFKYHLANFGIKYSRYNPEKKRGWHISVEHNWYNGLAPIYLGDIISREIFFLSYGIDKKLVEKKNFGITWYGELNGRFGGESYYAGGSGISWTAVPRDLVDFGLSIGGDVNYRLPFGMTFSFGIKQSFYYYRLDRGIPFSSFDDGSPRNVLTFSLGIGWNFEKK